MTPREIIAKAILDAMDLMDGLDATSADTYADAALGALKAAGYAVVPRDVLNAGQEWVRSRKPYTSGKSAWNGTELNRLSKAESALQRAILSVSEASGGSDG